MTSPQRRIPLGLEIHLQKIARQFHRQRRLKGWLKFGSSFVLFLLALGAMREALSVPGFLIGVGLAVFMVGGWWFWVHRPLKRKPTREQLAMFLDEQYPELQNLAISSVEFSQSDYENAPDWMLTMFFQTARTKTQDLPLKELTGDARRDWLSITVPGVWLVGLMTLVLGVMQFDQGDRQSRHMEPLTHEEINFEVSPGDVRLKQGQDLVVWVETHVESGAKAMHWRATGGDWQTDILQASGVSGVYYSQLENLQVDTEYQVQVGKQQSPVFRATVWLPPEVEAIHLTYHFPDYLGMSPKEVLHAGHIMAPESSHVEFEIIANKPLDRARLVLGSGTSVELTASAGPTWRGELPVAHDDTYRIELTDADGAQNEYQPEYSIVAQVDEPPEIRIRFPRGDDEATLLEEIPFNFTVRDAYGLRGYGVQYEVAGRESVRVDLNRTTGDATEVKIVHLAALEEMELAVGDLITWTVWAEDQKPGRAEFETVGDPYFLEIRPFDRSFREAVSNQGGQAPQMGQQAAGSPQRQAADQKQVIIATWNLRKQAHGLSKDEYSERLNVIIEAQQEVLETVLQREPPPDLRRNLTQAADSAIKALQSAEPPAPESSLSEAIRHQQRLYGHLLRMAPDESQVMQARNSQDTQSQAGEAQRDLQALELTQRRDFREEASTLREQQAETEAARTRIEELAKRQGLINSDISQLISEMQTMDDSGQNEAKRKLEQLQEEQQRAMDELDRLSGEIASGDMDAQQAREAQQQLEGARQQMDRSARNLSGDQLQQARAAGSRALGSLNEARQELEDLSRQAAAQRMAELQNQMEQMQEQQRGITEELQARREGETGPQRLESDETEGPDLQQEKRQLAERFKATMDNASELSEKSAETQGRMARELGDWLRRTAREGVYEDIQEDESIRRGAWRLALNHEEQVSQELAEVARQLEEVATHLVRDDLDAMERALGELEDLMDTESATLQTQDAAPNGQPGRTEEGDSLQAGRGSETLGWGPRTPEALQRFANGGYRDWVGRIRNAEDLIPEDSPIRDRLGVIRQDLDAMRRRFERDSLPPRFNLVFDQVIKPLTLAAEELRRSIQEQASELEFGPEKEGEVPSQYRAQVAEYFKALAEMK